MFVTVRIVVQEKKNTLAIPINTLIFRQNTPYVFDVDTESQRVEKRQIILGIGTMDKQEVLEGIEEGELLVTEGRYRLIDGMKVEILNM